MSDKKQAQPLVLVVEDFQNTREMYAEYLRFAGFRVAEAANGLEAIELAMKLQPDVILMDLALPRVDGWEATRQIKADPRTKRIPVVALTGHVLTGHAEGARAVGCDSFVTKPCLPDALVDEIRRMLKSRPKSATSTRKKTPGARRRSRAGERAASKVQRRARTSS